ncbi:MAG: hypothetical protein M1831_003819 [Alyxoria varia]|nr:MAG: hypothetical protein M1831_003819 [Alyxoria varia]
MSQSERIDMHFPYPKFPSYISTPPPAIQLYPGGRNVPPRETNVFRAQSWMRSSAMAALENNNPALAKYFCKTRGNDKDFGELWKIEFLMLHAEATVAEAGNVNAKIEAEGYLKETRRLVGVVIKKLEKRKNVAEGPIENKQEAIAKAKEWMEKFATKIAEERAETTQGKPETNAASAKPEEGMFGLLDDLIGRGAVANESASVY